jgi:hypothetical protein
MKSYTPCGDDVRERALALIRRFYPDLVEVQIRIDYIYVSNDAEDTPALTHGGYPAQAVVKILGPKERAMERGDAEIVIDEENWTDLSDAEKDALLDHELYHLEVVKNKLKTRAKRDCCGRPVLKIRKHDRQFGWFDAIARRHGDASAEVIQFKQFEKECGQLYLGLSFIEDQIAKLKPDGVESVTITTPGSNVGVKIDSTGVHETDCAGNPVNDASVDKPEDVSEADLEKAWQTVTELDRCAPSVLQRRLRIGYNRACRLIEALEQRGIVGPDRVSEPREILKPYAQQPAAA